jgi:hypothetical protein
MTNTRDKLDEARYFLEKMADIQKQFGRLYDPDYEQQRKHFRYNLNAFLSAFRAVTQDVLPLEFKKRRGKGGLRFQPWFEPEWGKLLRTDSDLDFLIEARHVTVHEKGIEPKAHFSMPIQIVQPLILKNPIVTAADGTSKHLDGSGVSDEELESLKRSAPVPKPAAPPITRAANVVYFFDPLPANPKRSPKKGPIPDPPKQDVLTVCSRVLGVLESFVARCTREFP